MGGPGLFFKSDAPFLEKNVQDLKISTAAMRCKIRQVGSQPRKMPKQRPYAKFLAIDLFSGCGGLTQGLKRVGFHIIAAVDNDPLAVKVYRANHPGVHIWPQDIQDVTLSSMRRILGFRAHRLLRAGASGVSEVQRHCDRKDLGRVGWRNGSSSLTSIMPEASENSSSQLARRP